MEQERFPGGRAPTLTWDPGNEPCFASWDFGALCQRLWWSEIQEGPEAADLIER